jgi:hypothetical protein
MNSNEFKEFIKNLSYSSKEFFFTLIAAFWNWIETRS